MTYDELKELIPEHAKDIKLNLDNVISRSSLDAEVAAGCAIAAAISAGIETAPFEQLAGETESRAAKVAGALMAMNNTWYPYVEMSGDAELKGLPANLRMTAYASSGGTSKEKFEAYALAASIVGKCEFCVKSHFELLKNHYTVMQLRDIGRIAAVIKAVASVI
jgi:alkyl hydroperoxide reductase subunit D